jgi:hypothetical protein
MEPKTNPDPGHDELSTHEAELTTALVGVAVLLTVLSFVTIVMTPFMIIAWVSVGVAMLMRPTYRRRTRHLRHHQG